ncbi:hypothetical protein DPMN_055062 [Dreissena polymorpha]|uniref:Uncharacterized protein n=1 Tax=Dreissena polymorpha TaxID=45954 RepID=A0A9D4HRW8_DREPO|nr:hypothetical protein DPMN_055062 [Dreissena polymorpha]
MPLHDYDTFISIGGGPISHLRFADDIDFMGGTAVIFKILPTYSIKEQKHTGWKSTRKSQRSW